MNLYGKLRDDQKLDSDVPKKSVDRAFLAHLIITAAQAAAADTDGVLAAVIDDGTEQTISTGLTNPPMPRNITATAGGTAGDIKAIQVTINGTNYADEVITEDLPAFTVDTAGTVQGSKAFKTITSVVIPAHDGNGATTAIGFGDKLGLPYKLPHNTHIKTYKDNTLESTEPTVTVSTSALESNTIDLNSALDGDALDIYLMV